MVFLSFQEPFFTLPIRISLTGCYSLNLRPLEIDLFMEKKKVLIIPKEKNMRGIIVGILKGVNQREWE
jgi:hypothetical protein